MTACQTFDVLDDEERLIGHVSQTSGGRWQARTGSRANVGVFDRPAEAVAAVKAERARRRALPR